MNEHLENMSLNEAIEVATKYAEDIAIFASVDKYAVSKVCEVLLKQLQSYKDKEDKYLDEIDLLKVDYAKSLENENTLRYTIKKYLKEFKQKEDKLRELVKENEHTYYTEDEAVEDCVVDGKYILQILNEGDK